jgi:hypothetical protein
MSDAVEDAVFRQSTFTERQMNGLQRIFIMPGLGNRKRKKRHS